jgi:long-chain acyl-CoA synthetase
VNSKLVCTINIAYPKIKKSVFGTKAENILILSPADSLTGVTKLLYKLSSKDKNDYEPNTIFWNEFFALGKDKSISVSEAKYDPEHVAMIVHTGGTTGSPKGVMLGDKSLNALAMQGRINSFTRGNSFLNVMPPFIAYGFAVGVHLPLSAGVVSVIIPNLDVSKLGKLIKKHRPNYMTGVPLHWQVLARDPRLAKMDMSQMSLAGVGGDAVSIPAEEEINKFLQSHGAPYKLYKGYGMTETASAAIACMGPHNKLGSVGFPLYMMTAGIFEPDTETELSYNTSGEICITGPNVMLGYYENPSETAAVKRLHKDGRYWIHTGDMGYMDEDGYVFIQSRIKRMIVRHDGFKVFPSMIENVIGSHASVSQCAAVAVTDTEHLQGKLPFVHVVPKKDAAVDTKSLEAELRALCMKELPEYALPVGFRFCDELPFTPIGKVDYRKLEETA